MNKLTLTMRIFLSCTFLFTALFSSLSFAADKSIFDAQITKASELKEQGNFEAAFGELDILLKSEELKSDGYARGYVETLMRCLQADRLTYLATMRHATKVAQDNKNSFLKIADELKTGELSRRSIELIAEMRLKMSRILVTHDFCVAPLGYEKLHETMLEGIYNYSKAWGKLSESVLEDKQKSGELQIQALMYFQKGNELFELSAMILERINR